MKAMKNLNKAMNTKPIALMIFSKAFRVLSERMIYQGFKVGFHLTIFSINRILMVDNVTGIPSSEAFQRGTCFGTTIQRRA